MDAITQALSIFADPASSLLPMEGTDPAGGSLFGALVAAFAKEDAQQDEMPSHPVATPFQEIAAAAGQKPLPVLAPQWLAQYISDAPAMHVPPASARGDEFVPTEDVTVSDPTPFARVWVQPAGGPDVGAPAAPIFEQAEALCIRPGDTNKPVRTRTENAASVIAEIDQKATENTAPLGLAPWIMQDSEDDTQRAVSTEVPHTQVKPQDNSVVRIAQSSLIFRASNSDEPEPKSVETPRDNQNVDPVITQFFAPLSIEEVVTPTLSVDEISGDGTISTTAAIQPQAAANIAPLTFDPRSTIPSRDGLDAAPIAGAPVPQQSQPQPHNPVSAPTAFKLTAANDEAVKIPLSQDMAMPMAVNWANGRAETGRPEQPAVISAAGADLELRPSDFTSEQPAAAQADVKPQPERPTRPANQQTARSLPPADIAPPGFASQMPNAVPPPAPPTAAPQMAEALSFVSTTTAADPGNAVSPGANAIPGLELARAPRDTDGLSIDALALRIAARSSGDDSRFTIRLDPPELGHIEVNLNVNSQGHAQAALVVEKPHTLELLQRDAATLERALKDAGLDLSTELSFSLKGEGASSFWRDEQNAPRGRNLEIVEAANANAAISGAAALAATYYGAGTLRLDITV